MKRILLICAVLMLGITSANSLSAQTLTIDPNQGYFYQEYNNLLIEARGGRLAPFAYLGGCTSFSWTVECVFRGTFVSGTGGGNGSGGGIGGPSDPIDIGPWA